VSSLFGGTGRRLGVLIYGDDRALQKTLARTETRLAAFSRTANKTGLLGNTGASLGMARGGVIGAGALAAGFALHKFVSAANDAQVVLGQTGVAVKNAGLDWQASASDINNAATRISKSTGFDDEDVLRSFQVFVRGQKDVKKSIDLSGLAADVARGRYTDLASGTMLVNKAAMGQIGALRRAGIQIDKNASATQALTALQKAYGGAAKKYVDSAAGASDNLKVAWENLAETAGRKLTPALKIAENAFAGLLNQMSGFQESAKLTADTLKDPKFLQAVQALNGTFKGIDILNRLKATQIVAPGEGFVRPTPSSGKDGKTNPPSLVTSLPAKLVDNLLNARLSGSDNAVKAALQAEASFIKRALGQKKLNRAGREGLKESLISVTDEINGINKDAADAAAAAAIDAGNARKAAADAQKRAADEAKRKQAEAARKAKEAARKAADAAKKAAEAAKKAAQALLDQGQALKDAALARLDAVQDKRDVQRDLADAKTELRHAKMIGGKRGILEANRNLQDAQLAQKRFLLEQSTVKPAGKTAAAGFNFNGATLHFHGVQNVQQLVNEITKLSKKSATQRRGRNGGVPHGA